MILKSSPVLTIVIILGLALAVAPGVAAQAGGGGGGGGGGGDGYEYDCGDGWDDDADGATDCDDSDCGSDPMCTEGGGGGGGSGIPDPPEHCALYSQLQGDGYTIESESFEGDGSDRVECHVEASKSTAGFSAEVPCVAADGGDSTLTPSFAGGTMKTTVYGWQVYEYDFETEAWTVDSTGWEKGIAKDSAGAGGSYHETEVFFSDDGATEAPYMRTVDHDLRITLAPPPSGAGWNECRSKGVRVQSDYASPGVWGSDYGRIEVTHCGREELPTIPPAPTILPDPPVNFDEHFNNVVRDFEDGATRWETRTIVTKERRHDFNTMITTLTTDSRDQYLNYSAPDVLDSSGEHRNVQVTVEGTGMPRTVESSESTRLDVGYSLIAPGPWPEYEFSVSYRQNATAYHVYYDHQAHRWRRRLDSNEVENREFTDTVVTPTSGILPLDLGNLGSATPANPDMDPRYTTYYRRSTSGFSTHGLPQNASSVYAKMAADGGPVSKGFATWDLNGELDYMDDGTASNTSPTAEDYDEHMQPLRDFEGELDNGQVEYFPDASGSVP